MAFFYGIHRINRIAMRFYGIRGILSVPRNLSVEFFQFHGIRGNWWNLAAHFHGMPWNFYITSGSTILPSFFMETTAFTKKFRPNTPWQYSTEFHHDSMAYLQTGIFPHPPTTPPPSPDEGCKLQNIKTLSSPLQYHSDYNKCLSSIF